MYESVSCYDQMDEAKEGLDTLIFELYFNF